MRSHLLSHRTTTTYIDQKSPAEHTSLERWPKWRRRLHMHWVVCPLTSTREAKLAVRGPLQATNCRGALLSILSGVRGIAVRTH